MDYLFMQKPNLGQRVIHYGEGGRARLKRDVKMNRTFPRQNKLWPLGLSFLLMFVSLPMQVFAQEKTLDFPDNMDQDRKRNVPIKFHLPEEKSAQPLILVSHGAGGSRDGLFALAEEMAKQGYVVMCLEHVTSNTDSIRARMRSKRLGFKDALVDCGNDMSARKNRPLDVKFAIDLAERFNRENLDLNGRIDLSQIGMIGHSYGAYTTMVCCGAKPVNIKEELVEPRVKLGIALSPQGGNGHFFDATSFSEMQVPFVGVSGNRDITQFIASLKDREDCFRSMPKGDKHFLWFFDAGHFSFSDPSGSGRKIFIKPDKDVTLGLKKIIPWILDVHLRGKGKLDEATRKKLVDASLTGTVKKIQWKTR